MKYLKQLISKFGHLKRSLSNNSDREAGRLNPLKMNKSDGSALLRFELLASESSLKKDWLLPEEDKTWRDL